jgi:hypothetical protein
MLNDARESISCETSGRYLEYIEKVAKKNIKIDLLIVDGQDTKKRLEHLSKKSNVKIQIIEKSQILERQHHETETELQRRSRANLKDIIDVDNLFILVVDDSELLIIPPLKTGSLSAITSTNKVLIFIIKMQREQALLAFESGK